MCTILFHFFEFHMLSMTTFYRKEMNAISLDLKLAFADGTCL